MQLHHLPAPRLLVQPIDVLSDHRLQFPGLFQFGQFDMGGVGLRVQRQHLIFIEAIEFLRLPDEEGMADDRLRRILVFHMIQPVLTAEIRNPALRRNAGASEEYNSAAAVDDLLQPRDLFHIHDAASLSVLLQIITKFRFVSVTQMCCNISFRRIFSGGLFPPLPMEPCAPSRPRRPDAAAFAQKAPPPQH